MSLAIEPLLAVAPTVGRAASEPDNPLAASIRAGGHRDLDLRGGDLRGQDLSGVDLSGADLSGARLGGANLSGANLSFCNLAGVHLQSASLDDAELLGCNLQGAELSECSAQRAGLGGSDLTGACLTTADLTGATLTQSKARGASFAGATLENARLRESDLTEADFTRCDLRGADLQESAVSSARFFDVDLRSTSLRGVTGYTSAAWLGADIRDANFCGAHLMRRHIEDENYLHEFKTQSRTNAILYRLWWCTSDCGRSFTRWAGFTGLLAVLFAIAYGFVAIDFGPHRTPLSPLYFSVVTLTTLGYGDAVPVSMAAQLVVMAEVITGYVALGGLLSVFATKMARRAD